MLDQPSALINTDPDATLILNGYEPVVVRGKVPVTNEWQHGPVTADRIAAERAAQPDALSTGLRTGRLVGVDVDLIKREHVAAVQALAYKILGVTRLERIGAKGAMLAYRNETPVKKITVKTGGKEKIEILGTGQQFVADGIHPETHEPYRWVQSDDCGAFEPLSVPLADLPPVTPEILRDFAQRAAELLTSLGYAGAAVTGDTGEARDAIKAPTGAPLKPENVCAMLSFLDADEGRDKWRDIIASIRATPILGGDEDETMRRKIAQEFSEGKLDRLGRFKNAAPLKYTEGGPEAVDQVFDTMAPGKNGGINVGSLIHWAQEAGYKGSIDDTPASEVFAGYIPTDDASSYDAAIASPGKSSRFRLMPRGEYRDLPLPCWLFEGLLPERGIALLVGHSQALKSFVAIDLAASVATGARAFNSLKPSKTGAAIYIAGEGQHGFKSQRVPAWEKVRGVSLSEAPFYLVENMPLAAGGDQFGELAAEITKGAGAARVRLIVLDTLATMAGALKENDAGDMGLCMAAAGMLARRFDCCVVVVHHPAKAARGEEIDPRGSGNLTAAADSIILAVRDGSGLRTKLVTQKQKDGETGGAVFLEGETVELATNAQGQRITSLALHTVTGEAFESAGDDLLAHVETALGRLGARGDATAVTTGRLARHMLQMQCPEIGPEGTALNPVQDRRLETIRENLRRQTGSARFAHIAMKIGRAKKAPWMWRLPYADAG